MISQSDFFRELERKRSEGHLDTQKYNESNRIWFYKGRVLLDPHSTMCHQVIFDHHDTPTGGTLRLP